MSNAGTRAFDAEAAVALAPVAQQHLPLTARAEVAFAMKDTGLAVSLAERVLRNWPASARAFIMLANCRAAAGDVAEAVALLDRGRAGGAHRDFRQDLRARLS
jgi:ATP/maltotriose-dependent transcriptional regulator MalT